MPSQAHAINFRPYVPVRRSNFSTNSQYL